MPNLISEIFIQVFKNLVKQNIGVIRWWIIIISIGGALFNFSFRWSCWAQVSAAPLERLSRDKGDRS